MGQSDGSSPLRANAAPLPAHRRTMLEDIVLGIFEPGANRSTIKFLNYTLFALLATVLLIFTSGMGNVYLYALLFCNMFLRSTKKAELELIAEHAASDVCAEESTSGDGDACGGDSGASKMKDD